MNKDLSKAPAKACTLAGGVFEFGDNGENAKTHPVKMLARSSQVIDHWFWGRTVHDFEGMIVAKSKIPMDYCHDTNEIVGYANHPEIHEDGLHLSGALIPFKESDKATEIKFKSDNGVPYESSINFAGDGIKVEFINDGEVATVNGQQLEGPLTIFRQWPLRGVAVCPYGADGNTASSFAEGDEINIFHVNKKQEVAEMAADQNTETVEIGAAEEVETVETAEFSEEVQDETETVETETDAPSVTVETQTEFSVSEFEKMVKEFGAEIAAAVIVKGGNMADGYKLKAEAAEAQNAKLLAQIETMKSTPGGGSPAKLSAPANTKKRSIFSK